MEKSRAGARHRRPERRRAERSAEALALPQPEGAAETKKWRGRPGARDRGQEAGGEGPPTERGEAGVPGRKAHHALLPAPERTCAARRASCPAGQGAGLPRR